MAGEIKYEIVEEIGVLSENAKGWRKELNKISWNGAAPKYDIRDWAPNHEKMGKGITLSEEDCIDRLKSISQKYDFDKSKLAIEITEDAIEKDMEMINLLTGTVKSVSKTII